MDTIDLSMTWGEWGKVYARFAESGETRAVRELRPDFARAMASCEALKALRPTLTDDQQAIVARVLVQELGKQGY